MHPVEFSSNPIKHTWLTMLANPALCTYQNNKNNVWTNTMSTVSFAWETLHYQIQKIDWSQIALWIVSFILIILVAKHPNDLTILTMIISDDDVNQMSKKVSVAETNVKTDGQSLSHESQAMNDIHPRLCYVLLCICVAGRCSGSCAHDYRGHACVQHQERDCEWC